MTSIDYELLVNMLINLNGYQLFEKYIENKIFDTLSNIVINANNENIFAVN